MNDEYCRIYNELIKDQCSNIVIDYDLQNKRYIYHPFSHMKSDTALNDYTICWLIILCFMHIQKKR